MDLVKLAQQIASKTNNPQLPGVPAGMVARPIIPGNTAVMELVPDNHTVDKLSDSEGISYPEAGQTDLELLRLENRKLLQRIAELERQVAAFQRQMNADLETIHDLRTQPKPSAGVVTDAIGLRFSGPQGTGTADRIKAVGGTWTWSDRKAKRGFWTLPYNDQAEALAQALIDEGRPCESFRL